MHTRKTIDRTHDGHAVARGEVIADNPIEVHDWRVCLTCHLSTDDPKPYLYRTVEIVDGAGPDEIWVKSIGRCDWCYRENIAVTHRDDLPDDEKLFPHYLCEDCLLREEADWGFEEYDDQAEQLLARLQIIRADREVAS